MTSMHRKSCCLIEKKCFSSIACKTTSRGAPLYHQTLPEDSKLMMASVLGSVGSAPYVELAVLCRSLINDNRDVL